jgi:hypothetical protein
MGVMFALGRIAVGLIAAGAVIATATAAVHEADGHPDLTPVRAAVPGSVRESRQVGDYQIAILFTPTRTAIGISSVKLLRNGKLVAGALVHFTSTMETMDMGYMGALPETYPGRYSHPWPALEMPGPWRLLYSITPPRAKPFSVTVVAHVA